MVWTVSEDALPLTAWYSDWKPAETLPLTSKHRGTNMKKFFIPLFAALLSCSAFAADAPTLAGSTVWPLKCSARPATTTRLNLRSLPLKNVKAATDLWRKLRQRPTRRINIRISPLTTETRSTVSFATPNTKPVKIYAVIVIKPNGPTSDNQIWINQGELS